MISYSAKFKILFISVASLFALTIFAHFANAATYYVDASGGNDSWDGTSQTYSAPNHGPWRTSSKLNWGPNFLGDDQILFKRGGVYSRLLTTSNYQSTDGHPITFGAYGSGEKPIITIAFRSLDGDSLYRGRWFPMIIFCSRTWRAATNRGRAPGRACSRGTIIGSRSTNRCSGIGAACLWTWTACRCIRVAPMFH